MNELKYALELWAKKRMREELAGDCEYCLLKAEQEALWERFKAQYPKEAVTAHINMIDLNDELAEREGDFLFWLGMRLGVLIGG